MSKSSSSSMFTTFWSPWPRRSQKDQAKGGEGHCPQSRFQAAPGTWLLHLDITATMVPHQFLGANPISGAQSQPFWEQSVTSRNNSKSLFRWFCPALPNLALQKLLHVFSATCGAVSLGAGVSQSLTASPFYR